MDTRVVMHVRKDYPSWLKWIQTKQKNSAFYSLDYRWYHFVAIFHTRKAHTTHTITITADVALFLFQLTSAKRVSKRRNNNLNRRGKKIWVNICNSSCFLHTCQCMMLWHCFVSMYVLWVCVVNVDDVDYKTWRWHKWRSTTIFQ